MKTFSALAILTFASAIKLSSDEEAVDDGKSLETNQLSKDDVNEIIDTCLGISQTIDWEQVKATEEDGQDAQFDAVWEQLKDTPQLKVTEADQDKERARHTFRGCVAIEKGERRVRKEKKEPELSAEELFNACKWLGSNITESSLKNQDAEEAWYGIKDLPEAQGWTQEAASEVMFHCLKAAEDFEKEERTNRSDDKDEERQDVSEKPVEDGEKEDENI